MKKRDDSTSFDSNKTGKPAIVSNDAPVFFDRNGRRWKTISLVLFALAIVAGLFLYVIVPKIFARTSVVPISNVATASDAAITDSASGLSPTEISAIVSRTNTPIIGTGPLVRAVHVQTSKNVTYAIPLYTTNGTQVLSNEDRQTIGDHEFAIQRYGQSTVSKQIALTYDDGPDPVYTPRILDVLAKNGVQATFFDTGDNVIKHSEIAARTAREGHVVANHTFNHVDFDFVDANLSLQEINQTTRVITAATETRSSFFRLPYMGNDEQSLRSHLLGILNAQSLGYVIASNDFDSNDYEFNAGVAPELPVLDGTSQIVLLHDAGGDRTKTIAYTQKLIDEAKAKGYRFVTLNTMYSQATPLVAPAAPTLADKTSFYLASSYLVYPRVIVSKLFFFTIFTIFLSMIVNVLLAMYNIRKSRFGRRDKGYNPVVSVIMSAYNEEGVLSNTVRSILASNYRNLEIIIVDDGSKDATGQVAAELAKRYKRVKAFTKQNGGKSSGLNFGIKHAQGEIIIGIDADTIFPVSTVGRLVRHFIDPEVGAVAGNVKVGNLQNVITRWQMLDYIIGIYIERNAQAALKSVMIVPGACGAWRKSVILAAGGYKHHTLAEDFDLTLNVHRLGYKVLQDNSALSYTEAPDNLKALTKQRFRWLYGTTQAFWKHRDMMFKRRYGWAGMFVMPYSVFTFLLPVVFIPILLIISLENLLAGNYLAMVKFFLLTIVIQFIMATIAVLLARERLSLLWAVPFTRFVYGPIRTALLYRTVIRALRGNFSGSVWNTARTGAVQYTTPATSQAKQRIQLMPVSTRPIENSDD